VTSGTGSGKSLTYFLPIVDALVRGGASDRVAALVIHLMNALVNSQLAALEKLKAAFERREGRRFPVTFAKYTGDTSDDVRLAMRQYPPQIILTNYVMAELLLVRPEDQRFLDRAGGGLRFLVLDELHTYRGRQGADVAMLLRRLARLIGYRPAEFLSLWAIIQVIIRTMTRISIQDLKASLSTAVAEAEAGATITITRHNEPVAQLVPVKSPHVHRGPRVGKHRLVAAVRRSTNGRVFEIVDEDRGPR
jgi:prevent-host-death family protein